MESLYHQGEGFQNFGVAPCLFFDGGSAILEKNPRTRGVFPRGYYNGKN